MKENLTLGLLVVIAVATLANTAMLMSGDSGVDYTQTPVVDNYSAVSTPVGGTEVDVAPVQEATIIENKGPKTSVQFAEMEHDFGVIQQDSKNTKIFTFTNTGEHPLIIENAKGSCGCTVPNYPRQPVQPGETGEIEVVYSPGKQKDLQTKTVTITANTEPSTTVLKIKANVESTEAAAEPAS